jgi:hypothetical protein
VRVLGPVVEALVRAMLDRGHDLAPGGGTLTVSYKGQEKKISVPDGVPIVTFSPATEADLKPGATVFVPAQRGEDGSLVTGFVVVGTNGVDPPM